MYLCFQRAIFYLLKKEVCFIKCDGLRSCGCVPNRSFSGVIVASEYKRSIFTTVLLV